MQTLDELLKQHEESDFEVKAAQGRDGRGELPNALWSTYSAMANTNGGTILLGIEEHSTGEFRVLGLQDIAKVRKAFWNNVNNLKVVNINLLLEQDVTELEQAGSGYPRIRRAWMEQHWRQPLLDEKYQPEQTVLRLPTTSLLPPEVLEQLDNQFGDKFRELGEIERLAVVTACLEEKVTNQRLRQITDSHASDLTSVFKSLVNDGFLVRDGMGWATSYKLSGQVDSQQTMLPLGENELASPHLEETSPHLPDASPHLEETSPHLEETSPHLEATSPHFSHLLQIAESVRKSRNLPPGQIQEIILALCRDRYITVKLLAEVLGRNQKSLQNHYISPMVAANLLEYRYPEQISHPAQGYRTVEKSQGGIV